MTIEKWDPMGVLPKDMSEPKKKKQANGVSGLGRVRKRVGKKEKKSAASRLSWKTHQDQTGGGVDEILRGSFVWLCYKLKGKCCKKE